MRDKGHHGQPGGRDCVCFERYSCQPSTCGPPNPKCGNFLASPGNRRHRPRDNGDLNSTQSCVCLAGNLPLRPSLWYLSLTEATLFSSRKWAQQRANRNKKIVVTKLIFKLSQSAGRLPPRPGIGALWKPLTFYINILFTECPRLRKTGLPQA